MNRNSVYILEDRGLLYINGEEAKKFLQNIITNNIENVSENRSCFSALLPPQGKYLYDLGFITKHRHVIFSEPFNINELQDPRKLWPNFLDQNIWAEVE